LSIVGITSGLIFLIVSYFWFQFLISILKFIFWNDFWFYLLKWSLILLFNILSKHFKLFPIWLIKSKILIQ
jgi:hypothetical protein